MPSVSPVKLRKAVENAAPYDPTSDDDGSDVLRQVLLTSTFGARIRRFPPISCPYRYPNLTMSGRHLWIRRTIRWDYRKFPDFGW